jgi:hypothetical protein
MKINEFQEKYNVNLTPKTESKLMLAIGKVLGPWFVKNFWTTIRLPGQRPTIYYSSNNDLRNYDEIPNWAWGVLEHELMHAEQQRTTWGLFKSALLYSILPLPLLFSGRWLLEREPYLNDIKNGRITVDQSVNMLWEYYFFPWPKSLMKKWFENKLGG